MAEFLFELFKLDVRDFARSLNNRLRDLRVTQNEYDALVSFSYNVGTAWSNVDNNSILRKQLYRANVGEITYGEASETLLLYNKIKKKNKNTGTTEVIEVPGLTRRRKAEQFLFNSKANPA